MTEKLVPAEAESLALAHFGIAGRAVELGGERTQNFRIRTGDGTAFTLKVSDPREDVAVVQLENAALIHLERFAREIAAPRVVTALDGRDAVALGPADGRYLRLLTYLEGVPLAALGSTSPSLRRSIGGAVASLDAALATFEHPFSRQRDLIWDVKNIGRLRPVMGLIDERRRPLATAMLARFEAVAGPHMNHLPGQAVHSDMNAQNILVAEGNDLRFAGFLDFGDLVHAPRIVDLAGAALLQIKGDPDDLTRMADVVEGYHAAAPLEEIERALLPEFMIARCVINVAVTELLASRNPENRPYIMKNNAASWMRLDQLSRLFGETKVMS